MPSYREHIAAGCCVFGIAYVGLYHHVAYTLAQWGELFLCTLVGSLLPDIDTKSKGQQLWYALSFILITTLILHERIRMAALIALCCLIPLLGKHRGLFHQAWFLVACSGVALLLLTNTFPDHTPRIVPDMVFLLLGALSHLVLDYYVRIPAALRYKKRW